MNKHIKSFKMFEDLESNMVGVIDVTNIIDTKLLSSLPDERNIVKVGDIVLATYFGGGLTTFEFAVEYSDISTDNNLMNLGNSDGHTYYDLANAYHVVKKDTYE